MLTILTDTKAVVVDKNFMKRCTKAVVVKLLSAITVILTFAGVFGILNAVGASDANKIDCSELIMYTLRGGLLCVVAYVVNFIKLVIK